MASQSPVEIWQKILKYAISVPIFFDSDPITAIGMPSMSQYRHEADYWQSERRRNSLRRVCKAWDTYLQLFDHRYVRLSDVHHDRIPASVIPLAVRLYLEPDPDCQCYEYCVGGIGFYPPEMELLEGMKTVLRGAAEDRGQVPPEVWRMEILDGEIDDDHTLFDSILERSPNLLAFIDCSARNLPAIQEKMPHMRALHFLHRPVRDLPPRISTLTLKYLTVLNTVCSLVDSTLEHWTLPSLLHLSISDYTWGFAPETFSSHLLSIVKNLGRNLLTLHHLAYGPDYIVPDDMWKYVPRLQRIAMPSWKNAYPPADHPVRFVRLHMSNLLKKLSTLSGPPHTAIIDYLPHWGRSPTRTDLSPVRVVDREFTVEMDWNWFYILIQRYRQHHTLLLLSVLWMVEYYGGNGTRITDSEGLTFDEYLVFAIRNYWKRGRASHVHNRPSGNPVLRF